jgi:hypothetical protein
MYNKLFTLFIAALLICNVGNAKIFRVGYLGPQISGVDFPTELAAYNAAAVNDTIQFYPGSYQLNSYDKKLFLVGNGYLLTGTGSNTGLNIITGSTDLQIIPVASSTGSDGTVLAGFSSGVVYLIDGQTLTNITITRCNSADFAGGSSGTITLTNCKITECYAATPYLANGSANANLTATNFRIENCVLNGSTISAINPASTIFINNCYLSTPQFNNNNVVVQNCIFAGTSNTFGTANSIFNNNIFEGQGTVNGTGNQFNVNISQAGANVLVGFPTQGPYSDDARYQLTATSPAKGAGVGGVDIGIFGGVNPYRLSGIPAIPSIYRLDAATPNATTNPYTITFSTRSNN